MFYIYCAGGPYFNMRFTSLDYAASLASNLSSPDMMVYPVICL